jgi:hypothetical protein
MLIQPATADRWLDVEDLFGANGAYSGCWCTFYRLTGREFSAAAGARAKGMLSELVAAGPAPGLLACVDGEVAGWCALAPREEYGRVLRSPLVKPLDPHDTGVWSITCFFVRKSHRRTGGRCVARRRGGPRRRAGRAGRRGVPVEPGEDRSADLYPGTVGMFRRAGFSELRRSTPRRVVMRRNV